MNEIEKLGVLLPHWIKHTAEHVHEFDTWARQLRAAGYDQVAGCLESAVQDLQSVTEDLLAALVQMNDNADS